MSESVHCVPIDFLTNAWRKWNLFVRSDLVQITNRDTINYVKKVWNALPLVLAQSRSQGHIVWYFTQELHLCEPCACLSISPIWHAICACAWCASVSTAESSTAENSSLLPKFKMSSFGNSVFVNRSRNYRNVSICVRRIVHMWERRHTIFANLQLVTFCALWIIIYGC